MVRLLVSVRDEAEALAGAAAGADFIDLKDPAQGALGGLAPQRIARIVAALRGRFPGLPVSATIGDIDPQRSTDILERVRAVAACGVDYVKVGVWPEHACAATTLLDALATCAARVVPVLVADDGVPLGLVGQALRLQCFPALLLDTARKGQGSLLQRVPHVALAHFVRVVRSRGVLAGLAGSLRLDDVAQLQALAPDIAGFRGAVTCGARTAALDPQRVRALRRRLAARTGARGALRAEA